MKCPNCGEDRNRVHRTDDSSYLPHVRRARLCLVCHTVFETVEQPTGEPYFKRKAARVEPSLFDEAIDRAQAHAEEIRQNRERELDRRRSNA